MRWANKCCVSMYVKLNITQFTVLFIGLLFGCLTFIGKVFRNNSGIIRTWACACLYVLYIYCSAKHLLEMVFLFCAYFGPLLLLLNVSECCTMSACECKVRGPFKIDQMSAVAISHREKDASVLAQTTLSTFRKLFQFFFIVKNVFGVFLTFLVRCSVLFFILLLLHSFIQHNKIVYLIKLYLTFYSESNILFTYLYSRLLYFIPLIKLLSFLHIKYVHYFCFSIERERERKEKAAQKVDTI